MLCFSIATWKYPEDCCCVLCTAYPMCYWDLQSLNYIHTHTQYCVRPFWFYAHSWPSQNNFETKKNDSLLFWCWYMLICRSFHSLVWKLSRVVGPRLEQWFPMANCGKLSQHVPDVSNHLQVHPALPPLAPVVQANANAAWCSWWPRRRRCLLRRGLLYWYRMLRAAYHRDFRRKGSITWRWVIFQKIDGNYVHTQTHTADFLWR